MLVKDSENPILLMLVRLPYLVASNLMLCNRHLAPFVSWKASANYDTLQELITWSLGSDLISKPEHCKCSHALEDSDPSSKSVVTESSNKLPPRLQVASSTGMKHANMRFSCETCGHISPLGHLALANCYRQARRRWGQTGIRKKLQPGSPGEQGPGVSSWLHNGSLLIKRQKQADSWTFPLFNGKDIGCRINRRMPSHTDHHARRRIERLLAPTI